MGLGFLNTMKLQKIFATYLSKSFKDSLRILEADIYRANTLASEHQSDGACLQFRISYTRAATFFLFLVLQMDCRLAEALGLLRILIYKVHVDGETTMSKQEKKASIKKFYAFLFPTLRQIRREINNVDDRDRRMMFLEWYRRRVDDDSLVFSAVDDEGDEECGICMEVREKFVIPTCLHHMCLNCVIDCKATSQQCPFCRSSLVEVVPEGLWVFIERRDLSEQAFVSSDNLRRLCVYVDRLPFVS